MRDDLYFRLAEQPITIPPLRERLCDMRTLAVSILEGEDSRKGLSPKALSRLQRYHWPGNIRELRNALRRAVVIGRDLDVLRGLREVLQALGVPVTDRRAVEWVGRVVKG